MLVVYPRMLFQKYRELSDNLIIGIQESGKRENYIIYAEPIAKRSIRIRVYAKGVGMIPMKVGR